MSAKKLVAALLVTTAGTVAGPAVAAAAPVTSPLNAETTAATPVAAYIGQRCYLTATDWVPCRHPLVKPATW